VLQCRVAVAIDSVVADRHWPICVTGDGILVTVCSIARLIDRDDIRSPRAQSLADVVRQGDPILPDVGATSRRAKSWVSLGDQHRVRAPGNGANTSHGLCKLPRTGHRKFDAQRLSAE